MVILAQWRMLLDVTPPTLGRVFVHGQLVFEDERDYNFTAKLVRKREREGEGGRRREKGGRGEGEETREEGARRREGRREGGRK